MTNGFSWMIGILPYVDQGPLFNQFNPNLSIIDESTVPSNRDLVRTPIPVFTCPSDPTEAVRTNLANWWAWPADQSASAQPKDAGVTAYPGYSGHTTGDLTEPVAGRRGVFHRTPRTPTRMRDLVDGTSNVWLVAERSPACSPWSAWAAPNGTWVISQYGINGPKRDPTVNFPQCYAEVGGIRYGILSFHDGGAHFLFGDGSVHFLSENMNFPDIRHLGHPADGLPVGGYSP